jgi:hypothetical protein
LEATLLAALRALRGRTVALKAKDNDTRQQFTDAGTVHGPEASGMKGYLKRKREKERNRPL